MKNIVFLLLSLAGTIKVCAQLNMVPNGSFETYTTCPAGLSQITYAVGWTNPNTATSDYFHICGTTVVGVPNNSFGTQTPAEGNAYAGLVDYQGSNPPYREYVSRSITQLTQGASYEVSLSISCADNSKWASNGIGVFFYDQGFTSGGATNLIPVTPQVSFSALGPHTNTTGWTRLSASFIADSAYDNIIIGGFVPNTSILTQQVNATSGNNYSYYYIDSIVVKLTSGIILNSLTNNMFCRGDVLNLPFTVYNTNGYLLPSNVFTLQLSDATGSFSSPVNIGSITGNTSGILTGTIPLSTPAGAGYRLRIKSSNAVDSSAPSVAIGIGNIVPIKPIANANTPLCTGTSLNMTASTPTPGVTWTWTGPSSYISTQQNPSIATPAPAMSGDYIVEASIFGCRSEKDTISVSISQMPDPITAGGNTPICAGIPLNLTATNTIPPGVVYSWTGPNSFTSSSQNPTIINTTASMTGDYIVTANNNGCMQKDTVSILINSSTPIKPTANSNSPVCTGNTLNLTAATSAPGVSWQWTGPNSYSSSQQNPSFGAGSTTQSGSYIVESYISNCWSRKDTVVVVINETPTAITASNSGIVCEPQQLTLSSTNSSAGVTWSWTGPLSYTSSAQNPVINNTTDDMSGNYNVTATKAGCSVSNSTTVIIKPTPVVSGFSNSPLCAGSSLNLTSGSTGTSSATYSWSGPLSFTVNQQNTTLTGATTGMSGIYTVTASFNGCSTNATVPVTIHPVPAITSATNNGPLCVGMQLQLNATSSIPASTYAWTGPNSFSSNMQNPTISNVNAANAGQYSVKATANSCTSAIENTMLVLHPIPYLGAYASPNDTICEGTIVTFVTVPMNGVINPQFQWFRKGLEIQGATNITYVGPYATGDSFYCRTFAQDICGNTITLYSNKIGMVVNNAVTSLSAGISSSPAQPLPGMPASFTATVISGGYTPKFQWKKNGVDVFGAITPNWNANNLAPFDEITCFVTTSDTCASPKTTTSNKLVVNFPTAIQDIENSNKIHIYPNPNNGSFKLKTQKSMIKHIEVLNATGQLLLTKDITLASDEITIDLGEQFANGLYILRMLTDQGTLQERFTVKR